MRRMFLLLASTAFAVLLASGVAFATVNCNDDGTHCYVKLDTAEGDRGGGAFMYKSSGDEFLQVGGHGFKGYGGDGSILKRNEDGSGFYSGGHGGPMGGSDGGSGGQGLHCDIVTNECVGGGS